MTKKPRVEIIHGGHVKTINCGYCGKGYTPQGIKAHEMWHAGNGHERDPTQFLNFGRVKVRGEPYSGAKSTSNVEDAEDNDDRVLKASKAEVKAKTLVCLSFKSFELGIPFDDKDPTGTTIDPHSELLFKSHVAKIEKMIRWSKSPFLRMKAEEKASQVDTH